MNTYIKLFANALAIGAILILASCGQSSKSTKGALGSNIAERVYVAPGEHDEFYAFVSGGFSGQLAVYGLPSGRLFKVVPVFSVDPEKAYGFNEETSLCSIPLLGLSRGMMPTTRTCHRPKVRSMADGALSMETIHPELRESAFQHLRPRRSLNSPIVQETIVLLS